MTINQYAAGLAHQSALGQMYCRDARKPAMTASELMAIYRRHKREIIRLCIAYNLLDGKEVAKVS